MHGTPSAPAPSFYRLDLLASLLTPTYKCIVSSRPHIQHLPLFCVAGSAVSDSAVRKDDLPAAFPRQAWGDVLTPGADSSGEVRLLPSVDTLQRIP